MLKVYTDGSCWPNPKGPAKWGFVIRDTERKVKITQHHGYMGKGPGYSNNVAEFGGLIASMEWLIENDYTQAQVEFLSDSKLLVALMSGRWSAKSGDYLKYYLRAMELKFMFKDKVFRWIPREQNTEADELSTMD